MPFINHLGLALVLLAATPQDEPPPKPGEAAKVAPATKPDHLPDEGQASLAPGQIVEPSRIEEARSTLPLPLLYGQPRLQEGVFVEYELTGPQGKARVRAASVGRAIRENVPVQQIEFEFLDLGQPAFVVLWLTESEPVQLDRVAAWAPPHTPVSIPIDLPVGHPQLRGEQVKVEEVEVRGPFAGKARRVVYDLGDSKSVEVTLSDHVPLFGVLSVRRGEEQWTAVAFGDGAQRALNKVPLAMPRAKGL